MRIGKLALGGVFKLECFSKKTGEKKWETETPNIVTNEGLDHVLNVYLHAATQITTWYLAIFEDDYTPLAANTYAVPGYTESTAYDEATRPEYVEAASTARSTTNSASKGTFTISDTKTIYGAALVSSSVKGDTEAASAVLFASGVFAAAKACTDDDVLELTYTISSADDGA